MRRCHSFIVIFTYFSCFGFNINPAVAANYDRTPSFLKVAQADSSDTTSPSNLRAGSVGEDVKVLQTQLKKLGYYDGIADGQFGATTRNAVIEFQQKNDLVADGIAGSQTRELIKTETLKQTSNISTPTPEPVSEESLDKVNSSLSDLIKLALIAMGVLAGAGTLFYIAQWLRYKRQNNDDTYVDDDTDIVQPPQHQFTNTNEDQKYLPGSDFEDVPATITPSPKLLPTENTSRLAKLTLSIN